VNANPTVDPSVSAAQSPSATSPESWTSIEQFVVPFDKGLRRIVRITNETNPENGPSVTLLVTGNVVTGELVSYARYLLELGSHYAKGITDENAKQSLLAQYKTSAEIALGKPPMPHEPQFIHLRKAHLVFGVGLVPTEGMIFRIRLSMVAGYSTMGLRGAIQDVTE